MRELLAEKYGKTSMWFHAIVGDKGRSYIRNEKKYLNTVCLLNLEKNSKIICDHNWIIKTNEFKGIVKGTTIKFSANVTKYYKKINGELCIDYCLTNVKNVRIVNREGVK